MRYLLALLLFCQASIGMAESSFQAEKYDEQEIEVLVEEEIGNNNTCLDEFFKRQRQVKRFLIWAPPIATVATPASVLAGGYIGLGISNLVGVSGWATLGNVFLGAASASLFTIGWFTVNEISKGWEFITNQQMLRIIIAAQSDRLDHPTFMNFVYKYNKKFRRNQKTPQELAEIVERLDQSGHLCDGEVRGYINPKNLKYSLAKRRNLIRYIGYRY